MCSVSEHRFKMLMEGTPALQYRFLAAVQECDMAEVRVDELEQAICLLKTQVVEQTHMLQTTTDSAPADALRNSLRLLCDKIYRMAAVRDAMKATRPYGLIH
jgi:hypothetical protein